MKIEIVRNRVMLTYDEDGSTYYVKGIMKLAIGYPYFKLTPAGAATKERLGPHWNIRNYDLSFNNIDKDTQQAITQAFVKTLQNW